MTRVFVQQLDLVVSVPLGKMAGVVMQFFLLGFAQAQNGDTGFQVTGDLVFCNQGFDQILGVFSQFPQLGGVGIAYKTLEVFWSIRCALPNWPPFRPDAPKPTRCASSSTTSNPASAR